MLNLPASFTSSAPRAARMRAASSPDDFARAPLGAYLLAERAIYWCAGPDLFGVAAWGTPAAEDLELAAWLWDQITPQLAANADLVIDLRRVSAITHATFARLHELGATRPSRASQLRRRLLLHPVGLPGAVVVGFCGMAPADAPWKCVAEENEGYRWLDRSDADAVRAMIEALAARTDGDVVPRLRALLVRDLAAATVPSAARALGVSSRSLQRYLASAGTSFRRELRRARIEAARELLAATSATVESVARSVGCESPSSFIRMFRTITGETPATYRTRALRARFQAAQPTA